MKSIKSFLRIKTIASESELLSGEVGILKNELVYRDFNDKINYVKTYKNNEDETTIILYGIRIYEDPRFYGYSYIDRVKIERKIKLDGSFQDIEYIGNYSGLSFKTENNKFYNGMFDSLEPFKSMTKEILEINEQEFYKINEQQYDVTYGEFTKLPIFFKNKEKSKEIQILTGASYNEITQEWTNTYTTTTARYYLISPLPFDDFYPVESHFVNGTYKNQIYIESDWRQQEKRRFLSTDNRIEKLNCSLISDVIYYNYLYYIYMIKTASKQPFINLIPQNKPVFIVGAEGFSQYNGYQPSMNESLKNMTCGKITDLSDYLTQEELTFYKYYVKLTTGTNDDSLFKNIFSENNNYSINGYTIRDVDNVTLHHPTTLIAKPKFDLNQNEKGTIWFLVNEILYYDINFILGGDNFEENPQIFCTDEYPYTIKLAPHFYTKEQEYFLFDGTNRKFLRKDIELENNTYTDDGEFCIDNLRNILPLFYNAYTPTYYLTDSFEQDQITRSLRKNIFENYNVIINSGSASTLLNGMTYEKSICFKNEEDRPYSPITFKLPYYDVNKIKYYGFRIPDAVVTDLTHIFQPQINNKTIPIVFTVSYHFDNKYKDKISFFIQDYSGIRYIRNEAQGHIPVYSDEEQCYYYKSIRYYNNKITLNWLSSIIYPLTTKYENYDNSSTQTLPDSGIDIIYTTGNNFFVSRLVCY